jgi:hypothetical protein
MTVHQLKRAENPEPCSVHFMKLLKDFVFPSPSVTEQYCIMKETQGKGNMNRAGIEARRQQQYQVAKVSLVVVSELEENSVARGES